LNISTKMDMVSLKPITFWTSYITTSEIDWVEQERYFSTQIWLTGRRYVLSYILQTTAHSWWSRIRSKSLSVSQFRIISRRLLTFSLRKL
jgi:hypothetical protein